MPYPTTPPSDRTTGQTIQAADINAAYDLAAELQGELGADPAGASATVTARLSTLDSTVAGKATIAPRVTTIASSATPTVNSGNADAVTLTAQAVAITSMTSGLTGTPTNFQRLVIRVKDNGTARAITWGASFEAKGAALPTTTVATKVTTLGFMYDTVTAKWGCVASVTEV